MEAEATHHAKTGGGGGAAAALAHMVLKLLPRGATAELESSPLVQSILLAAHWPTC